MKRQYRILRYYQDTESGINAPLIRPVWTDRLYSVRIKTGSTPDTQQEAYKAFFNDLDTGIAKIREYQKANPDIESFANSIS